MWCARNVWVSVYGMWVCVVCVHVWCVWMCGSVSECHPTHTRQSFPGTAKAGAIPLTAGELCGRPASRMCACLHNDGHDSVQAEEAGLGTELDQSLCHWVEEHECGFFPGSRTSIGRSHLLRPRVPSLLVHAISWVVPQGVNMVTGQRTSKPNLWVGHLGKSRPAQRGRTGGT